MNAPQVNKHLPGHVRASRGRKGHVAIEGAGLRYEMDKSRFNDAREMALYAASKIPPPRR